MSYCRWSEESDVYLFEHVNGYFTCFFCPICENKESDYPHFDTKNRERLKKHLQEHRNKGHKVPNRVFSRLQNEINTKGKFL